MAALAGSWIGAQPKRASATFSTVPAEAHCWQQFPRAVVGVAALTAGIRECLLHSVEFEAGRLVTTHETFDQRRMIPQQLLYNGSRLVAASKPDDFGR